MIRVLLVDDQKMVRETLKISLEPEKDLEIVGTADNGITAVQQVEALQPDIVVMNMEMPGLDGAGATQKITNRFTDTKVLILTSYDSDEYITKSLAVGAKGYLLKNTVSQDIAGAIRNVYKGYTQISPGLLEKLLVYTDSGVIISKLKSPTYRYHDNPSTPSRQTTSKTQKTIANLQVASRQQQEEITKLRHSLDNNQKELPNIKNTLAWNNKNIWLIWILWMISMTLIGLALNKLKDKTNNLQVTTDKLEVTTDKLEVAALPTERIGLYGEFSLNGIAQRVAKAFEQDPILADISTVYVAQEDDAIILTGKISNPDLLRRMENIAKQVTGVNKVYTSQVAIQPELNQQALNQQPLNEDLLGSQNQNPTTWQVLGK